jgi:hypothetical protein
MRLPARPVMLVARSNGDGFPQITQFPQIAWMKVWYAVCKFR